MATSLKVSIGNLVRSSLGKAFAGSFAVAILARLMQLGMAILLARQLGPAGYGTFTFALGAAILAAQFAGLGWPTLMARFIPQYVSNGEWRLLRGLVQAGDGVVFGITTLAAVVIYGATFLDFVPADLTAGLALTALLAVPMGFRLLRRQLDNREGLTLFRGYAAPHSILRKQLKRERRDGLNIKCDSGYHTTVHPIAPLDVRGPKNRTEKRYHAINANR